jgi:hypothetical protein
MNAAANTSDYSIDLAEQERLILANAMLADGRTNVLSSDEREALAQAMVATARGDRYSGLNNLLRTVLVRSAKRFAKPRVTPHSATHYSVAFDDLLTWTVAQRINNYGESVWEASADFSDLAHSFIYAAAPRWTSNNGEELFAAIAGYYHATPAPWGTLAEVHALAQACESDRTLYTRSLKKIALRRWGVKLGAKGSRGTGYSWVHVDVADGDNSPAAHALMQACWQSANGLLRRSETTSPCRGERFAMICKLAGHPTPEGFTVQAPYWD